MIVICFVKFDEDVSSCICTEPNKSSIRVSVSPANNLVPFSKPQLELLKHVHVCSISQKYNAN